MQGIAAAHRILYTGGGPTGSFLAAQAGKGMAIVRDPRLQSQNGRDTWVVAERGAALDIPSVEAVEQGLRTLLTSEELQLQRSHQEHHFPAPDLLYQSERLIVQEVARLFQRR